MGKDFLTGYCQLVTGEKDPRNLRLAFSIERVMLVEFDISESVEVSGIESRSDCCDMY
jgi:DNA repair/transcription protein MET18/MMS19